MANYDHSQMLAKIEQLLGGSFTNPQRSVVLAALAENEAGVMSLAHRVTLNPNVDNPIAVFLSSINRGEHNRSASSGPVRLAPHEAFDQLFRAKLDYMQDVAGEENEHVCLEAAIDYAVGYVDRCRISAWPKGETPLTLEQEYRKRYNRDPMPEASQEQRRAKMLQWARINRCLYHPRIASMFVAMRANASEIPNTPTHLESAAIREALIAEIEHLGVKPGPMPQPFRDMPDPLKAATNATRSEGTPE